jgi:hypothetical protein
MCGPQDRAVLGVMSWVIIGTILFPPQRWDPWPEK